MIKGSICQEYNDDRHANITDAKYTKQTLTEHIKNSFNATRKLNKQPNSKTVKRAE